MTEDTFWSIVALGNVDDDDASDAVAALAKASVEEMCRFEDLLAEKLYALDGWRFARAWDRESYQRGWVSPDGFLYARCAAVGRGRVFYESVLRDPEQMASLGDASFEDLLFVAERSYEQKTGKEFPHECSLSYATCSNSEGWADAEGLPDEAVSDLDDTLELLHDSLCEDQAEQDRPSLDEFSEAFRFVAHYQRQAGPREVYRAEIEAEAERRGIRIPDVILDKLPTSP